MSIFSTRMKPSTNNVYYGLALAAIFGIALFIRTYFPYENIFTGDWVRFQYVDAWYHMRLVDNLVQHFPHRICFDPYTFFPHGQEVHFEPFLDLFIGFFAWLFGAGSPSTRVIETTGAYFPAVLGASVTIPVYFIGKELFNKKAGLIAAALIAILPGEFLSRSLLGNTDHHIAEALLSTLTILFLILALKSAQQKEISFKSIRTRDWVVLRKPLLYALLAGIALGCYLLSWLLGILLISIIIAFALMQYILDHLRGRSTDYLCITLVPAFAIALFMVIPEFVQFGIAAQTEPAAAVKGEVLLLCAGIVAMPIMSTFSYLMATRNLKRAYFPLSLVALAGILLAFFYLASPSIVSKIFESIRWLLNPTETNLTVSEWQTLSLSTAWNKFTTGFYLSLISFIAIAYLVIKRGAPEKTLLLVWSAAMLVLFYLQIRFAYYLAVNVAILVAYLSWKALALISTKASPETDEKESIARKGKIKASKKGRGKSSRSQQMGLRALLNKYSATRYALVIVAAVALFFLAFYPNIGKSIELARGATPPSEDWHDTLVWLGENTPDPFEDPDFYYDIYDKPTEGEDYSYPESAYGVLSWWDYGHWITYIAHRIPNTNPHQRGVEQAALFFTSQDEATANEILDELGSRYIIIDWLTALHKVPDSDINGYFSVLIEWAGKDQSEFYEKYYLRNEQGALESIALYHPEYYQSMSSRLYFFRGEEVAPANTTWVISYVEKTHRTGVKYKEISSQRRFSTYEGALSFLETQSSPYYRIVGVDPLLSPVPLERLEHYEFIYQSPTIVATWEQELISEVEIFEYQP